MNCNIIDCDIVYGICKIEYTVIECDVAFQNKGYLFICKKWLQSFVKGMTHILKCLQEPGDL